AIPHDRADDDPAVHRDADREGGPRGGKLLEDERERDRRRAEAAISFRDAHPQHPERAELGDDLTRYRARLLGGRDARAKAGRPRGDRRGQIPLRLAHAAAHEAAFTFLTPSGNAGTNPKTSATTPEAAILKMAASA